MENEIKWEADMDVVLARASSENRPVLLDFYNPG
jgi:hypothetical protein